MAEDPDIDLLAIAPRQLVEPLRSGLLEAALVSSIEAFRQPGYRAVAGLGIASRGPVRSVRAFLRHGCETCDIKTVGIDESSETSVALLKILLSQRLGNPDCSFERIVPNMHPDEMPHDLVMMIGDHGLAADAGKRRVLDLGEQWQSWTGLPFVYALWLIGPGINNPENIVPILRRAHKEGLRRGVTDGTSGAVHYEISDLDLRGLERFRDEAGKIGLADASIELAFIGNQPKNSTQEKETSS